VLAVLQHYSNAIEQLSDQDTGFNVGPHNVTGYIKVDADELALWKNKIPLLHNYHYILWA